MFTEAIILVIIDYVSLSPKGFDIWDPRATCSRKPQKIFCTFSFEERSIEPRLAFNVSGLWNSNHKRVYIIHNFRIDSWILKSSIYKERFHHNYTHSIPKQNLGPSRGVFHLLNVKYLYVVHSHSQVSRYDALLLRSASCKKYIVPMGQMEDIFDFTATERHLKKCSLPPTIRPIKHRG